MRESFIELVNKVSKIIPLGEINQDLGDICAISNYVKLGEVGNNGLENNYTLSVEEIINFDGSFSDTIEINCNCNNEANLETSIFFNSIIELCKKISLSLDFPLPENFYNLLIDGKSVRFNSNHRFHTYISFSHSKIKHIKITFTKE